MQLVVIAALLPLAAGHGSARAETAAAHNDITVVDLCDDPALDACSSSDRALNFPTVSSTPTYSWNVNATLMSDVTTPTFDVVVAFQENLPAPFHYQIPLGRSSGAACGVVQVPFGVGAKGDRSPLPCPGCHIALTFPACPSGWKKEAPLLVEGVFKMGFFLIPGYEPTPNITVNVTVRAGNGGRIFDLTSHQRPSRKPETATALWWEGAGSPTMPAVQKTGILPCRAPKYGCINDRTVGVPKPRRGQALIEMRGSSANPADCDLVESGAAFGTLGMDGAGTVVSLGAGCDLEVGDEVYGTMQHGAEFGAYAQYAVASCSMLAKKPKSIGFAEAGTLYIAGGTSVQCLRRLGLPTKTGNLTVAVTSGQGGTGHLAIQLAKAMGAARVVTAATGDGIALTKALGADLVVDYREQNLFDALPDDSVDLVFDNFGARGTADKAMRTIKVGGTFLVLMTGGGGTISLHPKAGVSQKMFGMCSAKREEMEYLAGHIDAGNVKVHIFASYGLHEVRQAWAALRGHGVLGKISIDPSNTTAVNLLI